MDAPELKGQVPHVKWILKKPLIGYQKTGVGFGQSRPSRMRPRRDERMPMSSHEKSTGLRHTTVVVISYDSTVPVTRRLEDECATVFEKQKSK